MKLRNGAAIVLVLLLLLLVGTWLFYPISPNIQVVRLPSPAPLEGMVTPTESQDGFGVTEALLGGRFAAPASVHVVGELSQAAVEDIVDTIRSGKRGRAREALLDGDFVEAWMCFQLARRSNVEAIHEQADGSVSVVSAIRWPDQPVIRHANELRGWTANWKGTKEIDDPSQR